MSAGWRLRVRFSDGKQDVISEVNGDSTLEELRSKIQALPSAGGRPIEKILAGVPPVEVPQEESALLHTFIRSGDTVVVEVKTASRRKSTPRRARSGAKPRDVTAVDTAATELLERRDRALDNLAGGLLAAVTAPAGNADAATKQLRDDFKRALEGRQQETLANQRLAAVMGGKFEFEESETLGRLLNGAAVGFRVQYSVSARSDLEEHHPLLPGALLTEVVKQIHQDPDARENLKAYNMALQSPRLFWNIVKKYGGIEEGLSKLLPSVDWSFLETRKRSLSRKAISNKQAESALKALDEEIGQAGEQPTSKAKRAKR